MAVDVRYNINEIFQAAFGINSPIYMVDPTGSRLESVEKPSYQINEEAGSAHVITPYQIDNNPPVRSSIAPYMGIQLIEEQEALQLSYLGTPVMFPIQFIGEGERYQVYDTNGKLRNRTFKNFPIPVATLVDFSRAKIISRTNVVGGNGTVKEIYGFDDWQIRMRGVCLADKNSSPSFQKEQLLRWQEIAGSVKVDGVLFSEKSIYRVAITDINFTQIQAKPEVIPFEITAISDEPIELILKEKTR